MSAPTGTLACDKPNPNPGDVVTVTITYTDSDNRAESFTFPGTDSTGNELSMTLVLNHTDPVSWPATVTGSLGMVFTRVSNTGSVVVYRGTTPS